MIAQLSSLIPTPLHPAVVHLPIALAVLVPLFAVGAVIAIARGAKPLASWGITTALVAMLAMSSYVALETGEDQEEKVEAVVPEAAFERHEESADQFFQLSLLVLGISALGFLPRTAGTGARYVATAGPWSWSLRATASGTPEARWSTSTGPPRPMWIPAGRTLR